MKIIKDVGLKMLILIFFVGLVTVGLKHNKSAKPPELNTPSAKQDNTGFASNDTRDKLSALIDKVGPEKAYEQFKADFADKHFGVQHTAAHVMGELLYEKAGVKGLSVCDSTFAFGCYHSFFGRALAEQGLGIIPELDAACIAKFGPLGTGCQHGIGHGLMEYFSHSGLLSALDSCSATTQKKALFGCTSGVFMEYNVPIIVTDKDAFTQPRALDKTKPYEPCPKLPVKYHESCYYEMAQWWDKENNFKDDYKKIGQLCQAIGEQPSRESCFLGAGNIAAPSSDYKVKEAIAKCKQMPSLESQMTCQSGASWSFYASVTYRNLAADVCKDLPADSQRRCVIKSDLIGEGRINQNL